MLLNFLTDNSLSILLGSTITCQPEHWQFVGVECTALHPSGLVHNSNIIIKYEDDTTVVGHISNNDDLAYKEEIQ